MLEYLHLPHDFLSDRVVLSSVANISVWQYRGFNMIVILAAIQALPRDLYEAARIDGAGEHRKPFLHNGFAIVNFDLWANIGPISSYSDGLFWKWMGNSLIYAVGGGALSTVISMMTGYALAKLDFRGKNLLIAAIPRSGSPLGLPGLGLRPVRHPERTAGSGADRRRR